MTYEQVDEFRNMNDDQLELADTLTCLIENTLSAYPFKGMPRSMRFLGAGDGCMEIFCGNDGFSVIRNNGGEPAVILNCPADLHDAFCALIGIIYFGRKDKDFAQKCWHEFSER